MKTPDVKHSTPGNCNCGVRLPRRQGGVVMVLTTIGLALLVGIAAFSLDTGHALLNNTRLQDVVDASTLNAAKVIATGGTTADADAAVIATLNANAADIGYQEIDANLDRNNDVVIDYSNTLVPFVPGSTPTRFVRVTVNNLDLENWLLDVFGLTKEISVSAVSGPSNALTETVCEIFPVLACGCDPVTSPPGTCDGDLFGYTTGDVEALKIAAGDPSEVGPGNFYLLNLPGGNGGAQLRQNLAGGYDECLSQDEPAQTKTGNNVGPVVQGINLRFGEASGPLDPNVYEPDNVTDHPDTDLVWDDPDNDGTFNTYWDVDNDGVDHPTDIVTQSNELVDGNGNDFSHGGDYSDAYDANPDWSLPENAGNFERRIVAVPIGDCSTPTPGTGPVDLYGFGCFFLLQPVIQSGTDAQVFGEFIEECEGFGTFGETPTTGGPSKIVLYKDPDRVDS